MIPQLISCTDIAIVDRDTWTRQGNFSASGHDGEIGLLAWLPNGLYLASSGKDDQIIVWETEGRQPVTRVKVNGGTVTGLEFSPTDNALSWACVDGTFNTWTDPIPAEKPHPARQPRVHATRQNGLGDGAEGFGQLEADDDDVGEDLMDFDNDDWIIDDEEGGGVNYKDREASPNLGNGVREVGQWERFQLEVRLELTGSGRCGPSYSRDHESAGGIPAWINGDAQ